MMKPSFSDLFKSFRQEANLSIAKISHAIGKSDGYFRKIENYGFTPPTYAVCCQLADLFLLNKKKRREFMKQAYLERTQSEAHFLKEFNIAPINKDNSVNS